MRTPRRNTHEQVQETQVNILIIGPAPRSSSVSSDETRVKAWVGGLKDIQPLTEGGYRARGQGEAHRGSGKERMELLAEVLELEENRLIRQHVSGGGPCRSMRTFASSSTKRQREDPRHHPRGVALHHVHGPNDAPLINIMARNKLRDDLARLKSNVEAC